MFTATLGRILGFILALSIIFAGVVSIIMGFEGIILRENVISFAVSLFLMSGGFTATIIGGFGAMIVGPKLEFA